MKITRHTAKDMRQALRMVRDQLGPEAVILTSKRTANGVEVTAAIDFDAARVEAQASVTTEPQAYRPERFAPTEQADDDIQQSVFARLQAEMARETALTSETSATTGRRHNGDLRRGEEPAVPSRQAEAAAAALGNDNATPESAMGEELRAMRRILETQMAQLAWNDLTRRAPIHTEILRELTEVGLTQDFAAQIVAQLPAGTDITKARRLSIALMSQRLNVTGDRWLDKGGRIALVGPTGVGKTTALAKLAVRWVLRHGARSLALISADSVRIGAHDQMQALGQMLDVSVYVAESLDQIPKWLEQLGSARLVLIDTPGMSQRDPLLGDRMTQIAESGHGIETALVLSASTQAGANAETVNRFATANIASVLLTKVDEAASLGGILSVIARAELPICYVSEGQRVPEDLRPARALELVSSAVHLAKTSGAAADEDLLRRRYGEVAHALA